MRAEGFVCRRRGYDAVGVNDLLISCIFAILPSKQKNHPISTGIAPGRVSFLICSTSSRIYSSAKGLRAWPFLLSYPTVTG